MPLFSNQAQSEVLILNSTSIEDEDGNSYTVTFRRRLLAETAVIDGFEAVNFTSGERNSIIWAYAFSSSTPFSSSLLKDANSSFASFLFPQHDNYGLATDYKTSGDWTVDLFSNSSSFDSDQTETDPLQSASLHAVTMIFAWLICAPVGIVIPRYLKNYFGNGSWFRIHLMVMLCGVAGSSGVGFLLAHDAASSRKAHFGLGAQDGFLLRRVHAALGMGVVFSAVLQSLLGFYFDFAASKIKSVSLSRNEVSRNH